MILRQNVLLFLAILVLCSLFLFILFGENGLSDLNLLKNERDNAVEKNESLAGNNLILFENIERLKNDADYIESIARRELGMIGKDELIIKPKNTK